MKKQVLLLSFCFIGLFASGKECRREVLNYYPANDPHIAYTGRVDISDPAKPKFWSPGVYVQARFKGTRIELDINDEVLYDKVHNYIEIIIDNEPPFRIQTTGKTNHIVAADHLPEGEHTITICKDSESGNGYLELTGLQCEKLLPVKKPKRKIEFIGDSITCGYGDDDSAIKCGTGEWYDQHNAYMSYGPLTARKLDAQWMITAVSGIGIIHSCCNLPITMPQVYDKLVLYKNDTNWDFSRYTPDIVTICLGQNDGKQDSVKFCSAYVEFIKHVRSYYPKAAIVCLSSPMGNDELTTMLKHYLPAIVSNLNDSGDKNVSYFILPHNFTSGCDGHPNMVQHALVSDELTGYIKGLEKW